MHVHLYTSKWALSNYGNMVNDVLLLLREMSAFLFAYIDLLCILYNMTQFYLLAITHTEPLLCLTMLMPDLLFKPSANNH